MKRILLFFLGVVIVHSAMSQDKNLKLPMADEQVEYKEVVEVNGMSQQDLYKNAKLFFISSFKSAKNVLEIDDKEEGVLVGKGNFTIHFNYAMWPKEETISFIIKVECKDQKYRYTINSFTHPVHNINNLNGIADGSKKRTMEVNKGYAQRMINEISSDIRGLVENLKSHMAKKAQKDDF